MRPIILLAFANDKENAGAYLSSLKVEREKILRVLREAGIQNSFEIIYLTNVTVEQLFNVFQNPKNKNRIAVFHFAGHSSGNSLVLESYDSLPVSLNEEGLIQLLKSQDNLKLVFLNGSGTSGLVKSIFLKTNIPFVVAGVEPVPDTKATNMASYFYENLAKGLAIERAFSTAKERLEKLDPKVTLR